MPDNDPNRHPARRVRLERARETRPTAAPLRPVHGVERQPTGDVLTVVVGERERSPLDGGGLVLIAIALVLVLVAGAVVYARAPSGESAVSSDGAAAAGNSDGGSAAAAPVVTPGPPAEPTLQETVAPMVAVDRSCVVVMDGRDTLVSINPTLPLTPASAQKVLVARAALDVLGVNFQFSTKLMAKEPGAGIVDEVWLVGGGDPTLATPEYAAHLAGDQRWKALAPTPLDAMAKAVSANLRHVGVIHGDATRYPDAAFLDAWKQGYMDDGDISPVVGLTVNGGFVDWAARKNAAPDPAIHAASEFRRLLADKGVLTRDVAASRVPAGATVVSELKSPALADIVAGMLKASDNLAAEIIVREIGIARASTGTTAAGLRATRDHLRGKGVPVDGLAMADGSGLARANTATCAALVGALDHEVVPRLSLAGRDGTLRTRFTGTALAGKVKAKTGWIAGVVSIVGEMDIGRPVRFAIVQNGVSGIRDGQAAEERILLAVQSALSGAS